MQVRQETRGGQLILAPGDSLMCGGRAEQFESVLQEVIAAGHRHVIVDLSSVGHIDSGGVRVLVSGHLTVNKQGGRVSLANLCPTVRRVFSTLRLDTVFPVYDSIDAALADVAGV
jgi:anti-sigma B factor antagonist